MIFGVTDDVSPSFWIGLILLWVVTENSFVISLQFKQVNSEVVNQLMVVSSGSMCNVSAPMLPC